MSIRYMPILFNKILFWIRLFRVYGYNNESYNVHYNGYYKLIQNYQLLLQA